MMKQDNSISETDRNGIVKAYMPDYYKYLSKTQEPMPNDFPSTLRFLKKYMSKLNLRIFFKHGPVF